MGINFSIGVLGGGQLGMFISQAAKKLNIDVSIFSDKIECSAKKFCKSFFYGDFNDLDRLDDFLKTVDVVTVETENLPLNSLKYIEEKKKLRPSWKVISIAQNRIVEKKFLNSIPNINTAPYLEINNFSDLQKTIKKFGETIIKTTELGYDGKGQFKVDKNNLNEFKKFSLKNFVGEKIIDFKKEISVIIVTDQFGGHIIYPAVENIHKRSILDQTKFPPNISKKVKNNAQSYAINIAREIKLIGIMAIEMFLLKDDTLLINELAPRPHNSGHWTLDCCKVSQFENLVLSISNQKIKDPGIYQGGIMKNVIGNEYKLRDKFKKKYIFYDYYKKDIKPNRKMAHYIETNKIEL